MVPLKFKIPICCKLLIKIFKVKMNLSLEIINEVLTVQMAEIPHEMRWETCKFLTYGNETVAFVCLGGGR